LKTPFVLAMILPVTLLATAFSQQSPQQLIALDDSIGVEIDSAERSYYRLFPGVEGFKSARIMMLSNRRYRLEYVYETTKGLRTKTIPLSGEAMDLTRQHIALIHKYQNIKSNQTVERATEAQILYLLGLKYAARARYDLVGQLWDDVIAEYPGSDAAAECQRDRGQVERLRRTKTALFIPGALLDQSGRTNLMIFSGYYGVWMGIATPIALKARSPQAIAAGLLLGAPVSLLAAHHLSKQANMSDARALMIAFGGHLGTWQGIGWAALADLEGHEVIGIGQLASLAGIALATGLTQKVDFSTAHAILASASMPWGAWFGAVTAALVNHSGDNVLRDMLIGSNALILGTGFAGADAQMSESRLQIINLAGVVGAVLGFGIDLLAEIKDIRAAFGIAGLGSVAGLIAGYEITKNFDRNRHEVWSLDIPMRSIQRHHTARCQLTITPNWSLLRHSGQIGRWMPCIGFQTHF